MAARPIDFIGPTNPHKTRKFDPQRTVNLFVCEVEAGKSKHFLQSIPGLSQFSPPAQTLSVLKTQEDSTVEIGETVTYTVVARNIGTVVADGQKVSDTLPPHFTLTDCDIVYAGGSDGPATATSGELASGITVDPWPVDATATITIEGTFDTAGSWDNTATAGGATSTVTTVVAAETDPLWDHVVLLIQNGEIEDKSQYHRTLTTISAAADQTADTPSGKSILINGDIRHVGLSWFFNATTTPELVYGSDPVCIETFYRYNGAGTAGQLLYADEFGFRSSGILLSAAISGVWRVDINNTGPGGSVLAPHLVPGTVYHLAFQKIGTGAKIYVAGTGYTVTGFTGLSGDVLPDPLIDPVSPSTPPCIGNMGGVSGLEDFNFDQYRITTVVARYTGDFTPPTALFPEG